MIENNAAVMTCFALAFGTTCVPIISHPRSWPRKALFCAIAAIVWVIPPLIVVKSNLAKELQQNEGTLYPSNIEISTISCGWPEPALKVLMGTNVEWITQFPRTLIAFDNKPMLKIDKAADGSIIIDTLKIFDDRCQNIVHIENNTYWIFDQARKKHPDRSHLAIYDYKDQEAVSLQFLNPKILAIRGIFTDGRASPVGIDDYEIVETKTHTIFQYNCRRDIGLYISSTGGLNIANPELKNSHVQQ